MRKLKPFFTTYIRYSLLRIPSLFFLLNGCFYNFMHAQLPYNKNAVMVSAGSLVSSNFKIKNGTGDLNLINPIRLNTTQFGAGIKKFYTKDFFTEFHFLYGWQNFGLASNISSKNYPQINTGWNNFVSAFGKSYVSLEFFPSMEFRFKRNYCLNLLGGLGFKYFDKVGLSIGANYDNELDSDSSLYPFFSFSTYSLEKRPYHLTALFKAELLKQFKSHHQIGLGIKYQLGLQNMFEGSYVFFEGQKDESRGDWYFRGSQLGAYLTYQYLYNANKKPREKNYVKPVYTYVTRRNQFYLEASHNWVFSPQYKNIIGNIKLEPWQMWTTSFGLGYTRMLNNKWGLNLTAIMNLDKLGGRVALKKQDYIDVIARDIDRTDYVTKLDPALKFGATYHYQMRNNYSLSFSSGLSIRYFYPEFYTLLFGDYGIGNTFNYLLIVDHDFYYEPEPRLLKGLYFEPSISKQLKKKNMITVGVNFTYSFQKIIDAEYHILPDTKYHTVGRYTVDGHQLGAFVRYTLSGKRAK